MPKYSFKNDYAEGAHPKIIQALSHGNLEQEDGYGKDNYCQQAANLIRKIIKNSKADIHFVSGGTQANLIVISAILKPYESVIAASTGHIAVHEAGAIEASGHKINIIESKDGKLTPQNIQTVLAQHQDERMVKPKLVFISNSTEIGSIYSQKELQQLSVYCKKNHLLLYLDGARLASALTSLVNDLSLAQLSKLVDVFYIGGTKNGALLGEAIIINNDRLKENFRFNLKQKGALLAKGRILGLQFLTLFQDNLFFELANHANLMAFKLVKAIRKLGYNFLTEPASNQIFPIFPNKLINKLHQKYEFYVWQKIDQKNSAIRLVTSWATKEEAIDKFINTISL
ncbi:MAG: threonine aldolase, threonine aldolase [Candidatus Peregrinibacteria bacterium GW2011_GWF2_33_10]|nr:MAG: threonine aldolase, threonine aldolase [Candidatus Peregrinibacteria bacterium GW2011_GWF2_33_10]OGJ44431.1 MAG: threonine aldolase [Candidatus Peregrinibacteria bacterium RIFOXYA2_FULL_33_21]OGJ46728.1 MAG: threonine aldolase [Candidatus Peregrinibacteria bacterium RIFOXYA12_FULL_33_12]